MKLKTPRFFAGMLIVILASSVTTNGETAAELIDQAHKHDNMYTLGPAADQQKALSLYQLALSSKPDSKQRLHTLYRMAQLNGSAYQMEKGEKPDFHKAIRLYKEIIDSYPPDEPLVYKAMTSICDHYTTLGDFESALTWSKKVLDYDTRQMEERLKAAEKQIMALESEASQYKAHSIADEQRFKIKEQKAQVRSLKKALSTIKRHQTVAVEQVAYSAALINPLRAHGELRAIANTHAGTFIAERASELLQKNMDRMPQLWAPQQDWPAPTNPILQADFGVSTALNQNQKHIQIKPDIPSEVTEGLCPIKPNATEKPQKGKYAIGEPRAPPPSYLSRYITIAAGLIVLVFAAITIIRKVTTF